MSQPDPPKCKSNTLFKNTHAVSLCELLTLDTVVIGAVSAWIGSTAGLDVVMNVVFVLVVLLLVNYLHYLLDIPTNVNYYLGYGKPPHVFKVCKCVAPSAAEPKKAEEPAKPAEEQRKEATNAWSVGRPPWTRHL